MELGLEDRVVVITAADSGIGLAVARAFPAEGARVIGTAAPSKNCVNSPPFWRSTATCLRPTLRMRSYLQPWRNMGVSMWW